ncbi:MAG: tRNA lysidine(34) synthetase TilS [Terricaulis sp.]
MPGDAGAAYSRARETLMRGNYAEAEVAFSEFLEAHADAATAPDARYWFAFTLLARNNFTDAAANFVTYLQAYPNGPRAPDAQVRLGIALAGMGQNRQACSAFNSLPRRYPRAPQAVRDLAQREAAALSCTAWTSALLDEATLQHVQELSPAAPILIALSGGGDSTALLHLMRERFGRERVAAIVIDHALREGSSTDAVRAAAFAEALGVRAEIITLTWPGGPKRAQASARQARHRALCAAANRHGARIIATGHTLDDQAETLLMRAAAQSSWRGLAGMRAIAPAPVWPEGRGLLVARPLLNARRTALRDDLRARGAAWIEDPSNQNVAFARCPRPANGSRNWGSGGLRSNAACEPRRQAPPDP